jgi:hypothetical protein
MNIDSHAYNVKLDIKSISVEIPYKTMLNSEEKKLRERKNKLNSERRKRPTKFR